MGNRQRRRGLVSWCCVTALLVSALVAAAPAHAAEKLDKVTIGYSAWPGWFPLAVADKAGIFEQNGLDVDLKYFSDYIASLDAMTAGQLDANTQTLNDTMAAVAGGSKQAIIVVNDNSAGNDAIICDSSIKTVADMKGKTVAAEQGVVDHFLLLQGLAKAGHDRGRHRLQGRAHRRRGDELRRRRVRLRGRLRTVHRRGAEAIRGRTWCSARRSSPASSPTTSSCRRTWWRSSPRWRRSS